MSEKTLVYSHRVGAGYFPENSIPALKHSLSLNIDAVDFDVVLDKNKNLIVYHDPLLCPDITRDETKAYVSKDIPIKTLSLKDLKKYDIGRIKPGSERDLIFPHQQAIDNTKISSLDEILTEILSSKKKLTIQIEIKLNPHFPEQFFSVEEYVTAITTSIIKHDILSQVEIQSFNWPFLIKLQKSLPGIKTSYLLDVIELDNGEIMPEFDPLFQAGHLLEDVENSYVNIVKSLGGSIIGPHFRLVTKKLVENAHKEHLKVVPWTVDDPQIMKSLIKLKVDGIISNVPKTLINIQESIN